jgi:hypothetical protein
MVGPKDTSRYPPPPAPARPRQILNRIIVLRGNEPRPGCDELTAADVQALLSEGDETAPSRFASTSAPARTAPGFSTQPVLNAAERELSNA